MYDGVYDILSNKAHPGEIPVEILYSSSSQRIRRRKSSACLIFIYERSFGG